MSHPEGSFSSVCFWKLVGCDGETTHWCLESPHPGRWERSSSGASWSSAALSVGVLSCLAWWCRFPPRGCWSDWPGRHPSPLEGTCQHMNTRLTCETRAEHFKNQFSTVNCRSCEFLWTVAGLKRRPGRKETRQSEWDGATNRKQLKCEIYVTSLKVCSHSIHCES